MMRLESRNAQEAITSRAFLGSATLWSSARGFLPPSIPPLGSRIHFQREIPTRHCETCWPLGPLGTAARASLRWGASVGTRGAASNAKATLTRGWGEADSAPVTQEALDGCGRHLLEATDRPTTTGMHGAKNRSSLYAQSLREGLSEEGGSVAEGVPEKSIMPKITKGRILVTAARKVGVNPNAGRRAISQAVAISMHQDCPDTKDRQWEMLTLFVGDVPRRVPRVHSVQRLVLDVNSDEFLQSYAWRKLRMQALKACGARCGCCGATAADGVRIHVDHIKPRRNFPELAFELSNLQVLCEDCNHGKGNWDSTDWRYAGVGLSVSDGPSAEILAAHPYIEAGITKRRR